MTAARLAPSLVRLRDEINRRWPGRDTASDGWLGDAAHQSGVTDLDHDGDVDAWDAALKSQHNPDGAGVVHALDVDKDGIDADQLVRWLVGHPAVWYVIWNRRIWSRTHQWAPRAYTGVDPHTGHVHVSITLSTAAESSTARWIPEDDMPLTATDLANVRAQVEAELKETMPSIVLDMVRRYAVGAPEADRRDLGDGAASVPLRLWEKAAAHAYATRVAVTKLAGEIADDPTELAGEIAALLLPAVGDLPTELVQRLASATADELAKRLAAPPA